MEYKNDLRVTEVKVTEDELHMNDCKYVLNIVYFLAHHLCEYSKRCKIILMLKYICFLIFSLGNILSLST